MLFRLIEYFTGNLYQQEEGRAEGYIREFLDENERESKISELKRNKVFHRVRDWVFTSFELTLSYYFLYNESVSLDAFYMLEYLTLEAVRNMGNFDYKHKLTCLIASRDQKLSKMTYQSLAEIQNEYEQRRNTKGE